MINKEVEVEDEKKKWEKGAPGVERVRGFLGVDGTLNSKYRRCEIHVAVGVEYYIHVPQVTQGSCV